MTVVNFKTTNSDIYNINLNIQNNGFKDILNSNSDICNLAEYFLFNLNYNLEYKTIFLKLVNLLNNQCVEKEIIQFSINNFKNLITLLKIMFFLKNSIRDKNKNFFLVTDNKILKSVSKFNLFNFIKILQVSTEALFSDFSFKSEKMTLVKVKLKFNLNHFSRLEFILDCGSLGYVQLKLKICEKNLDLDIFYRSEQVNKLLKKTVPSLKNTLIKYGIFLKRVNFKKNDFL